jgi:hypothetical protein
VQGRHRIVTVSGVMIPDLAKILVTVIPAIERTPVTAMITATRREVEGPAM